MIVPIFDNGDVFYGFSCNKDLINRLQSLQNYAIRTICLLQPRTNTDEKEKEMGLLPLERRWWLHSMQLAHYLASNEDNLSTNTRTMVRTRLTADKRKQLRVYAPQKTKTERCFSYQIRRQWNTLPTSCHTASGRQELLNLLQAGENLT